MIHRRQFFQDTAKAAGVVLTGHALAGRRLDAQPGAKPRRQVMVGGRRVRTIDVHAHVVIPEARALMGLNTASDDVAVMAPARFETMDAWGTDMQVLMINPTWYSVQRDDVASRVIEIQNARLAELCARYPDRFVAFATVALQFPELAAAQLEKGIKKYNLRGVGIGGKVNGEDLSAPKFDPFWKKAEELGCVVFMHPQGIPDIDRHLQGNGNLFASIGYPIDTAIFLARLMFDGTLDRFPGLKICAAHGGGFLPSYVGRFDYACVWSPKGCPVNKKKPSEYLRQLYFDSIVFTPEGVRHLVAECGASQIMIGTDYPYRWSTTTVDQVLNTPGLSDADKRAILGENAARLLGISA